jgi:hypothetical protein
MSWVEKAIEKQRRDTRTYGWFTPCFGDPPEYGYFDKIKGRWIPAPLTARDEAK